MVACARNEIGRDFMSALERQEKIIELVSRNGSIQVERLAELLDVSQMTIRRDLEKLKTEGIIQRKHGIAVMKEEVTYREKMVTCMSEKKRLAQVCASFVKQGDTVFLDSGTTIYEIAKLIKDIPDLTVITNDIEIGFLLHRSNVELLLCGGFVQKETGSIYGSFANQMMNYVQTGIAFMGAMSIDNQFHILTPTLDKATLKRMIVKNAAKSYLVVDQSKFNRKALMKINHMKDYTGIVTTRKFTKEEMNRMKEQEVHLIPVEVEN